MKVAIRYWGMRNHESGISVMPDNGVCIQYPRQQYANYMIP